MRLLSYGENDMRVVYTPSVIHYPKPPVPGLHGWFSKAVKKLESYTKKNTKKAQTYVKKAVKHDASQVKQAYKWTAQRVYYAGKTVAAMDPTSTKGGSAISVAGKTPNVSADELNGNGQAPLPDDPLPPLDQGALNLPPDFPPLEGTNANPNTDPNTTTLTVSSDSTQVSDTNGLPQNPNKTKIIYIGIAAAAVLYYLHTKGKL